MIGWEHALLVDLGGAMSEFIGKAALTSFAATRAVSYTAFHALASAVAFPVALLNSASMIDSPWALVEDRARAAGEALAEALLERRQGVRPVTLVGYSLGAKVIAACAKALIERGPNEGRGLVMDVVLVGAPLDTSETDDGEAARRKAGWRLRKLDGHCTGYFRPPPRPKSAPSTWASCAGPEAVAAEERQTTAIRAFSDSDIPATPSFSPSAAIVGAATR